MAMTGCCSPKPPLKSSYYWARAAPAQASIVAGLCCLLSSSSYLGFDVCHTRWSLFIVLLGFPCVSLCLIPMLGCSCSPTLTLLFSICLSFSYPGCFLLALCKITSLLPAVGHDLRCPTGSILAAFHPAMHRPLLIPLPASPKSFQEAPGSET